MKFKAIAAFRVLYALLSLVFLWFASLQLNDIDAAIWIIAYVISALLCAVFALGINHRIVPHLLVYFSTCIACWIVLLIPQVNGQFWDGEVERELGGLSITFSVNIVEYFLIRKMSRL